jgi:PAS domain S-box-containing protein
MPSESLTTVLQETLGVFEHTEAPLTTTEVADEFAVGRRSTYERLERLVENDQLETKKVGASGRIWWRPATVGDAAGGPVDETAHLDREQKRAEQSPVDRDEQFRSLVEATEEYAIFTMDTEGYVQTWNPGAERIKGYEASEIVGEHFSTFYTEADRAAGLPERNLTTAAEEGSVENEGWRVHADGSRFWANVTITPIRDDDGELTGYAKVTRDMTERHAYERHIEQQATRLERQRDELESELEAVFERIDSAFYALDDDFRFDYVNDRAERLLGLPESELLGRSIWDVVDEADDVFRERFETAMDRQEPTSFEHNIASTERWALIQLYPSTSGLSVYATDITGRKEREHRLEATTARLSALFENSPDMIDVLDADGTLLDVNQRLCAELGYPRSELIGSGIWEFDDAIDADGVRELLSALSVDEPHTVEGRYLRADGSTFPVEVNLVRLDLEGDDRFIAISRDISERLQRERELETRVRQQEVVTDLGKRALETGDLDDLLANAAELVAETLGADYCKVLDLDTETEALRLRQGVGWDDGIVGSATVSAVETDSQASYTLLTKQPVVVSDLSTESRFNGPDLLTDHDVRSGISTIIGPIENPWGILGVHDGSRREFSSTDARFVQSVAHILSTAISRRQYEQQLVAQRERVDALNDLNDVIREITTAVIDQSTREEIEATVCERLAATDSYLLAWTGEIDTTTQEVDLRTEAGVTGYTDEITISTDQDDPLASGPTGTALRTGETQVVNDISTDSKHDPWRTQVDAYGFRSSAAIPIVHEGTVYGVLNVYADRPYAFEQQERAVIDQLGKVIGHAIAATERKRALMSTELVELDFRITDVATALDVDVEITGTTTLDHVVPIADDEFLIYGTATADAIESLTGLVDVLPHWETVEFYTEDDPVRFELRMSDPPILSEIAAYGGYVDSAVIEDDDYRMTIHLAPTADVGQVADLVRAAYPQVRLLRRQQITKQTEGSRRIQRRLTETLTDRQSTALETAYHAGYFEWPRDSSAQDLASTLGIAPATFHQHLRKAQKQVFDELLSTTTQQRLTPTTA